MEVTGRMRKVIFICYMPLTQKRVNDFYIDALLNVGFHVEYWDITDLYSRHIAFTGEIKKDYVKKVKTYEDLRGRIAGQDNNETFYVIMIGLDGDTIRLYRILTLYNCLLLFFARGFLPNFSQKGLMVDSFKKLLHYIVNYREMPLYFRSKLVPVYKAFGLIKTYDIVFAAGSVAFAAHKDAPCLVPIHYFDYDDYLLSRCREEHLIPGDYCVYLDDNVVYDSDFLMQNKKTLSPDKYYEAINRFFLLIEEKFKVSVIIAAHPKSIYKRSEFGERKIIWNKTNELTRECKFALTHFSSSVAYPISYKKPIVFMHTEEMKHQKYFAIIKSMSNHLDASLVNIDSLNGFEDEKTFSIRPVNEKRYDDYIYSYLASKDAGNRLSKDIVVDFLSR